MDTKSFAVCEAGLESGMVFLTEQLAGVLERHVDLRHRTFRSQFATDEFPNPPSGPFIAVDWYDDLTPEDPTCVGTRTATA